MNTYQIVVLSGDGIGPEIVDGALQVLETLQKQAGRFHLDFKFYEAGAACYQNTGERISRFAFKLARGKKERRTARWQTAGHPD